MPEGRAIALLAHQGGWDEILLVAGPIALVVVLLTIVKRRVDAAADDAAADDADGFADDADQIDDVTRR